MIICLYGPDSYRRQEKLNEYAERYKKKYGCGAEIFYLDKEEGRDRFKDFCKAQSLFESSKLGAVFNFSDLSKSDLKKFISLVKDNLENKDLTLILNSEKKPVVRDFAFLLAEPVISYKFDNLEPADLRKFLDLEIKKREMAMDSESKGLLLSAFGPDTRGIISELDKLALLDEKSINKKILERHIDLLPAVDVFSHLNRIKGSQNIGDKLLLLEELLNSGADPAMIFNMSAASPYLNQEQKIKMADYDAAIKSGKLEYEEVLTDMILR